MVNFGEGFHSMGLRQISFSDSVEEKMAEREKF